MLAATLTLADLDKVRFPVIGSPKLDGIRFFTPHGEAKSRWLKDIPNLKTRALIEGLCKQIPGLVFDGEIVSGGFGSTQSAVSTIHSDTQVELHVFDLVWPTLPAFARYNVLCDFEKNMKAYSPYVHVVEQEQINGVKELEDYYAAQVAKGYEGICLRSLTGLYKYGRSTFNQQWLLKMKALEDMEARIVGFDQFAHNANEPTVNELGYQVRSSHAHGMVYQEALGAFKVVGTNGPFEGVEFNVGSGLTPEQRKSFWFTRDQLRGKIITVTYQRFGSKNKPRQPIFKGFRSEVDYQPGKGDEVL